MKTMRTTVVAFALFFVLLAGLGGAAYVFRGHLATVPLVGALLRLGDAAQMAVGQGGMDADQRPSEAARAEAPSSVAEGGLQTAGQQPDALGRAAFNIDLRRQQLIGVRTAAVERRALTRTIRTIGLVEYDETRLADVNLKLEGWIRELYVDYTGRFVRKGEPLFTIYSPDLVATQTEYLLAIRTRDQVQQSQVAEALEYAERLVESARRRLELWDLPPGQIAALEERREPHEALLFESPAEGFVIEKRAVQGMHVRPGDSLYRIADLSTVWIEGDFYEADIGVLREGQRAAVTLDAYPGERFAGQVIYIYPYVEDRTRTVRVRFAFPNPGGRLKPGMYANVELDVDLGAGVTVPANALLDSGTRQYVFIAAGNGQFDPRRVRVGQRLGEAVQILEGLEEGEHVATNATFFIDAESQLRAALDGFEAPPAAAEAVPPGERLQIAYRSQPDPPRTGDNILEVEVRDPEGQPVTDAEVSVLFYMAAMPTMNMPAMRTEASLAHVGNGAYRGPGNVMMGGRWEVTVQVTRDGERIGSQQFTVVAR